MLPLASLYAVHIPAFNGFNAICCTKIDLQRVRVIKYPIPCSHLPKKMEVSLSRYSKLAETGVCPANHDCFRYFVGVSSGTLHETMEACPFDSTIFYYQWCFAKAALKEKKLGLHMVWRILSPKISCSDLIIIFPMTDNVLHGHTILGRLVLLLLLLLLTVPNPMCG